MRRVIICIHGIGRPRRQLESGEAPYWISEDLFHETLDRVSACSGEVDVRFTFDDGNSSDVEIAASSLARAGHAADMFLLTDRIETAGSIGRDGVAELVRLGHRIGSHGAAHRDWTSLSSRELRKEIEEPRRLLSEMAGHPVTAAAIPFGRYNRSVLSYLKACGFNEIYSSDGGPWREGQIPIPRTSLTGKMTGMDVERILRGPDETRRRLRRICARLYKRLI